MKRRLAAGVITLVFPLLAAAQSPPLVVLSSNATRAAFQQLAPALEKASGRAVEFRFANSADLRTRIEQGERFDVAVLSATAIETWSPTESWRAIPAPTWREPASEWPSERAPLLSTSRLPTR